MFIAMQFVRWTTKFFFLRRLPSTLNNKSNGFSESETFVNKTLESSVISYQPELSKKANQAVRDACPNGSFANTFVDQSMLNILLPTRHPTPPCLSQQIVAHAKQQ
jgi:hypothetical protein